MTGMVRAAYRGGMQMAAVAYGVASSLPGAPSPWRTNRLRLGRLDREAQAVVASARALWVHAASVGELTAVRPLLVELRERTAGRIIIVSTTAHSGLAMARTLPEAHLATMFPFDAPGPVRSVVARVRLDAYLFTETEIWPTWLETMREHGIPSIMVSGRVSDRTLRRARWLRPLFREALAEVTCCMQTEEDARRIVELGADPRRVHVAGSLKFDAASTALPEEVERLGAWLRAPAEPVVVAGSTHEGEEEMLLDAYRRLALAHRDLALVIAPRHLERLGAVEALARERGFAVQRSSAIADSSPPAERPVVVLLDRMGLLAASYRLATVAFVGGSLVPVGGHNVIEPAQAGVPVVVGPHTDNAPDVVDRLVAAGGAVRVGSTDALALALDHLLGEPAVARGMGHRARATARTGQGALERHVKIITARLSAAHFAQRAHDE